MKQVAKAPTRLVFYGRRKGKCMEVVIDRLRQKRVAAPTAASDAIFNRLPGWYRL